MAALTGRRPATSERMARSVASSARPSDPLLGSLTSIKSTPALRAIFASVADRTLTSKPGRFGSVLGMLHRKEPHPAATGLKGNRFQILEAKTEKPGFVKPLEPIEMM